MAFKFVVCRGYNGRSGHRRIHSCGMKIYVCLSLCLLSHWLLLLLLGHHLLYLHLLLLEHLLLLFDHLLLFHHRIRVSAACWRLHHRLLHHRLLHHGLLHHRLLHHWLLHASHHRLLLDRLSIWHHVRILHHSRHRLLHREGRGHCNLTHLDVSLHHWLSCFVSVFCHVLFKC